MCETTSRCDMVWCTTAYKYRNIQEMFWLQSEYPANQPVQPSDIKRRKEDSYWFYQFFISQRFLEETIPWREICREAGIPVNFLSNGQLGFSPFYASQSVIEDIQTIDNRCSTGSWKRRKLPQSENRPELIKIEPYTETSASSSEMQSLRTKLGAV